MFLYSIAIMIHLIRQTIITNWKKVKRVSYTIYKDNCVTIVLRIMFNFVFSNLVIKQFILGNKQTKVIFCHTIIF